MSNNLTNIYYFLKLNLFKFLIFIFTLFIVIILILKIKFKTNNINEIDNLLFHLKKNSNKENNISFIFKKTNIFYKKKYVNYITRYLFSLDTQNFVSNNFKYITSFSKNNSIIVFLESFFEEYTKFVCNENEKIIIEFNDKETLYLLYSMMLLQEFLDNLSNQNQRISNENLLRRNKILLKRDFELLKIYIIKIIFWLLIVYFYKLFNKLLIDIFDNKDQFITITSISIKKILFLYNSIKFISNIYKNDGFDICFGDRKLYDSLQFIFIKNFFNKDYYLKYYKEMINKLDYNDLDNKDFKNIEEQILVFYEIENLININDKKKDEKFYTSLWLNFFKSINYSINIYKKISTKHCNKYCDIAYPKNNPEAICRIIYTYLYENNFKTLDSELLNFQDFINTITENVLCKSRPKLDTSINKLFNKSIKIINNQEFKKKLFPIYNNRISFFLKSFSIHNIIK